MKPKVRKRKKIIDTQVENREQKQKRRKQQKNTNKAKSLISETNKIDLKSDYEERSYKLPESRMREVALLQILQILKWIMRKYYEQLHANKLKNLDENGQIPGEAQITKVH